MKLILLGSLNRELNDSTSLSSSNVKDYRNSINEANRYSITATERTSVFNYLLETESNWLISGKISELIKANDIKVNIMC